MLPQPRLLGDVEVQVFSHWGHINMGEGARGAGARRVRLLASLVFEDDV